MVIKRFNENWDSFDDFVRQQQNVNSASDSSIRPKEEFNEKDFEVVGIPSGQIIYMTINQIAYFKSRDVIKFMKVWKKPVKIGDGPVGYVPVKLGKYVFQDSDYNDITELIEDIVTWD